MAFAPVSFIIPEYDRELYSNWWLKAYEPGITTPKTMATDSTGVTTASRFELNSQGFPITAGNAFVVPHIDGDYDLWLFPTAAEADANDTTNALQFADNLGVEGTILSVLNSTGSTVYRIEFTTSILTDTTSPDVYESDFYDSNKVIDSGAKLIATGTTGTTGTVVNSVFFNGNGDGYKINSPSSVTQLGAVGASDESSIAQSMIDDYNTLFVPKDFELFAVEIELADDSYVRNRGTITMVASSPEWARIFTNKDRANGNKRVTIDNTDGNIDGNYPNQSSVVQQSLYFVECSDFDIFGGKFGRNSAPQVTPSNHPEGPFDQGVPYGEASVDNPTIGCVVFMGGINNTVRDYTMRDWQQEGVQLRWNEGGLINNFKAINGPETDDIYYTSVDFGSRDTAANLSIGSHVLVQSAHMFAGVEQQPDLIYSSLVSGVTDLTLEDFTDTLRWTLVERDITNDLGFTAARTGGAKGQMNIISNGFAAFCRASSFSQDSELSGMSNLHSYHNAFFNGINWGHETTPAARGYGNGLVAINAGWKGSAGGLDFGIGIVSESSDVSISDFYVSGAKAKGINISGNSDEIKVSNGTIKFSGEEGLLGFNSFVKCVNVTSRLNTSLDFNVTGTGRLSLSNCEDSDRRSFNTDELYPDFLSQTVSCLISGTGSRKEGFLSNFAKPPGQPLVRIFYDDGATSADNATLEIEYLERNAGSGAIGNQYAVRETFLISGSSGSRNIASLVQDYSQGRQFNVIWSTDTIQVFLQDTVPSDVAAVANQNSIRATISSQVSSGSYQLRLG